MDSSYSLFHKRNGVLSSCFIARKDYSFKLSLIFPFQLVTDIWFLLISFFTPTFSDSIEVFWFQILDLCTSFCQWFCSAGLLLTLPQVPSVSCRMWLAKLSQFWGMSLKLSRMDSFPQNVFMSSSKTWLNSYLLSSWNNPWTPDDNSLDHTPPNYFGQMSLSKW